ncbi:MAG: helix-hairpin-helix domain-containing protein [Bacilli bacterium]
MEKFLDIYNKYREYILFGFLFIIFLGVQAFIFWYFSNDINNLKSSFKDKNVEEKEEKKEVNQFVVDIKGEVKKPGVYILDEGKRVIDVVKKAGGFTVYADTSANNLGKKITDEMVIVIYSETEINNYLTTKEKEKILEEKCKNDIIVNDSCVEVSSDKKNSSTSSDSDSNKTSEDSSSSNDDKNKLVSLNSASKEELMTLSGIGESKALAIIEYRNKKKFETIEEIKEVSGIGDALFEKIKDNITI